MKIALVSPYDYAAPGGVGAHIFWLKKNLTRMGHKVKVIAPSSHPMGDDLIVVGRPIVLFPSNGSIARTSMTPVMFFAPPVRRILNREGFDLIHYHEPMLPPICLNILRFSQTTNIGTFHACHGNYSRGYTFWRPVIKPWFDNLHGRIAVSNAARDFVNRYFPAEYRIIPNGIELEHFAADVPPIEEFCDDKLNILFVSRLEKRKGLGYLLDAYEKIKDEFPNTRLIVVGSGNNRRQDYRKYAHEKNLKDVAFVGPVSYQGMPRYYRTADIFCAPATGNESFGIILLEAMAASKPIIASNIDGYSEVVSDGVDGLLVEPQDEDALAQALRKLLSDKSLREQLGAGGRAKVEDYSWERVSQRVMSFYEELVNGTTSV